MIRNFKHSSKLIKLFESLDKLEVPFKATILENSVLTYIDDSNNILKVACLVDNLETLDD